MKILLHQPMGITHGARFLSVHKSSLARAGHNILTDGSDWKRKTYSELIERAHREKVDILHLLTIDGGKKSLIFGSFAALTRPPGFSVIGTLHNFPRLVSPAATLLMCAWFQMKVLDGLVVPAGDNAKLGKSWPNDPRVLATFEPISSKRMPEVAKRPVVLFAGLVNHEKGAEDFVRLARSVLSRVGLKGLIAGECRDPDLRKFLLTEASRPESNLEVRLERLPEANLETLLREAKLVWCGYRHTRASGIAYRAIELNSAIVTYAGSVPASLVSRHDAGIVLPRGASPDQMCALFRNALTNEHAFDGGLRQTQEFLSEQSYAGQLTGFYRQFQQSLG